jgi:hypothetical protein
VPGWSWTPSNKRIENVNAENKKENYQWFHPAYNHVRQTRLHHFQYFLCSSSSFYRNHNWRPMDLRPIIVIF